MNFTVIDFCRMTDYTLLSPTVTMEQTDEFIKQAKKNNFICTYMYPRFISYLAKAFEGCDIKVGGAVSFPYGAETTDTKLHQVKEFLRLGASELDFVMNINLFKSGMYDAVLDEIKQIVSISEGKVTKAIIEVGLLTDDEIMKASDLVARSDATFIKTATGTTGIPTTPHHIQLIKSVVGDKVAIKAAGGVRNLDTVKEMLKLGVTRFGINKDSALSIITELSQYRNGIEI